MHWRLQICDFQILRWISLSFFPFYETSLQKLKVNEQELENKLSFQRSTSAGHFPLEMSSVILECRCEPV